MESPPAVPVVLFANSPYMGGMEEHVLLLGRGLVRRGFRVAALCPPHEAVQPLRRALADAGVAVHCPTERQTVSFGAARRLRELVQTLRRYPGCILHLHLTGHSGGGLLQLAGQLAGARAMVRTEHLPPVLPIPAGERLAVRIRDQFLARIICVSQQTRQDHLDRLGRDPRKCVVVPNCVDLERFSPDVPAEGVRAEFGIDPHHPIIGTVSRLHEHRKGVAYFLEMAAAVARVYPMARFLIVGDGSLRAALERQAEEFCIADRVVFTGARRDIPRLLAAMQVFVMPSLYEGGPYTVLEAMAMAKPVVATPVGLVPDVITDGATGYLAPVADSAALADAVLRLLSDDALAGRLGRAGREVVAARFSLDAMVDGVADLYRQVV
ncbi:MAG: glycosyltransferase family 4 protein [Chloroflexota bacterium]